MVASGHNARKVQDHRSGFVKVVDVGRHACRRQRPSGNIRFRVKCRHVLAEGDYLILRNDIAGKRTPQDDPACSYGRGRWIINDDRSSAGGDVAAEVALNFRRRRDGHQRAPTCNAPRLLEVGKKPRVIPAIVEVRDIDRASHRTAKLVFVKCGCANPSGIVNEVVGVKSRVLDELIQVAVQRVSCHVW